MDLKIRQETRQVCIRPINPSWQLFPDDLALVQKDHERIDQRISYVQAHWEVAKERDEPETILHWKQPQYANFGQISPFFPHKGVGRGYQMQGGMVRRIAKGPTTEVRHPAEWFNPILEQSLPELANKLAEINADAVVNATRMMIE